MTQTRLSVILPAHQEQDHILCCLRALARQTGAEAWGKEVIVVANGCTDATADRARSEGPAFAAAGWTLTVIETAEGGKIGALNLGDEAARGDLRLYLDADVVVGEGMIAALIAALDGPGARYAGARLVVPRPASPVSAAYARFWQRLPFVAEGVTGAGLFAVNAEGRARWGRFPQVISDDGFARLNFAPSERQRVEVPYHWPISEGLATLIRVRRRQDAGTAELARLYPDLAGHASGDRPSGRRALHLGLADPAGFAAYAVVSLAVRLRRPSHHWERAR
ncbi:glycosyltransferase family 2 protein (plasmid) [Paracoccus liaowanqingii]|uniref:Glycosyltransferase family 2 protein n=1 Tax=Paracoccus liaowanqingii TaxID=2560053 RepID=A0A4Y5SV78_9RHOB|nr:glycosyltransferase family 2 protein [Paracoccus liaowanqingii]QDA36654.1 glycosyltransferase family 2 protein [Paracoccus liaowanqingii]